ncbi:MAG: hypothetical protein HUU28_10990 [Planctomycetaceae bacterium]|nr:hypothetical protein [Planctomycetaceae bacterium]
MKSTLRLLSLVFVPAAVAPLALVACVAQTPLSTNAIRLEGAASVTSIEWREDFTVYELLTQPGVLSPTAETPSVEVHRTLNGSPLVIPVDFAKIHAGDSSSNILLRPGDLVRIFAAR